MKISVALAAFNGGNYLKQQLESLALQERLPDELVVADDQSFDSTVQISREFARTASFPVRVLINNERLGYGFNFLKAASYCSGDYICFCDQDDYWKPQKLSRIEQAAIEFQPEFIAHSGTVVSSNLQETGKMYPSIEGEQSVLHNDMQNEFFYPGFSIAVSRDLFAVASALAPRAPLSGFAHDELICELARNSTRKFLISESLVLYRQHGANLIGFHGAMKKRAVV